MTNDLLGLRVLLVDDSTDSSDAYELALGFAGAEVASVATVDLALAALDREPFDVVVSDLCLEGKSGLDLARTLRHREPGRGLPAAAIALTGLSGASDRVTALEAGFDAYIVKPCPPSELARAIGAALGREGGA